MKLVTGCPESQIHGHLLIIFFNDPIKGSGYIQEARSTERESKRSNLFSRHI